MCHMRSGINNTKHEEGDVEKTEKAMVQIIAVSM